MLRSTFDESFEDVPDWQLQNLVHLKPDQIDNIADEAIRRAIEDPSKKWIVDNVIGHTPSDQKKEDIRMRYEAAKEQRAHDSHIQDDEGPRNNHMQR